MYHGLGAFSSRTIENKLVAKYIFWYFKFSGRVQYFFTETFTVLHGKKNRVSFYINVNMEV